MIIRYDNHSVTIEANQLQKKISALRQRGQLLTIFSGTVWIVSGAILLILVLVAALGWWGGSNLRTLGWIGTIIGIVAIALGTLVLPLKKIARREAVARRIGEIDPRFASDILSASELAHDPAGHAFSPVLVVGHLRAARNSLSSMPRDLIFPVRLLTLPATE